MGSKPTPKPMTDAQRAAAQQHVDKLTRWDSLFNLGRPGVRQLRGHIRRERAHYLASLQVDALLQQAATTAPETPAPEAAP